jgi:hypothetical protein
MHRKRTQGLHPHLIEQRRLVLIDRWDDTGKLVCQMRMRAADILEQLGAPRSSTNVHKLDTPRSPCHMPPNELHGLAFSKTIAARSEAYALVVGAA